ncbi:MAG: lysozyme [Frankiales bacterium]|nr:lysozyme [Frankiales bacterium]
MRLPRLALSVLLAAAAIASPALAGSSLAATGPDVSRYQHPDGGPIDWQRLAAGGQDFTFIKATEGTDVTNAWYDRDRTGARAAGLYTGAYHFARPSTSPGSAASQARTFAARIGDQSLPGTLPPALDLETSAGLSATQLVSWTRTFLTTLEGLTGRQPVVYTYPSFWKASMGGTRAFAGYPLWIAHYTSAARPTTSGWDDWTFWQYSSTSTVPGIKGDVDMNRFAGTDADLARLALAPVLVGASDTAPTGTSPGALEVSSDTAPGRYVPVAAQRVLDTRTGVGAARGPARGALTLTLPATVPADAAGVVLSVSAVSPTGAGYLRVAAAGQPARTTALTYVRGASTTGLVVSRTDAARRAVLTVTGGATHLAADLVGYYDVSPGTGGHYVPLVASRVLDTRRAGSPATSGGVTVTLPDAVPAGARAAVLNVSVVGAVHDSFVQVVQGASRATVLNLHGGTSRTGLVLAPGGRTVSLALSGGPAHLVVDLLGYYAGDSTTGSSHVGTVPARVVDTRQGLGGAKGSRSVTVTLPSPVPAGATALLDVSAVDPTGDGYLRVGPAGEEPTTTALTTSRGASQTGLVMTRTDALGRVTLTLHGAPAGLVVDLVGYSAPVPAAKG